MRSFKYKGMTYKEIVEVAEKHRTNICYSSLALRSLRLPLKLPRATFVLCVVTLACCLDSLPRSPSYAIGCQRSLVPYAVRKMTLLMIVATVLFAKVVRSKWQNKTRH